MTTCVFSAFFLGKSTALTVAAPDQVKECPREFAEFTEIFYQTDPKTMLQHIEEAAVTSSSGKGKMSGKRVFQNPVLCFYKYNIQAYNQFCFLFSLLAL